MSRKSYHVGLYTINTTTTTIFKSNARSRPSLQNLHFDFLGHILTKYIPPKKGCCLGEMMWKGSRLYL